MRKILILEIALLLISISFASAQASFRDGFIIVDQQDTIFGKVAYRTNARNYRVCRFKKDGLVTRYTSSQIDGFGYMDDKFFSSKVLNNQFAEVLVKGDLSLYKHKRHYYIRKLDGGVLKFESKNVKLMLDGKEGVILDDRWKKYLTYLVSDCNIIGEKKLRLTEKKLGKVITDYNKCRGTNFTVYRENRPWVKMDFGVAAGITRSSIKITERSRQFLSLSENYISVHPSAGLLVSISSPRTAERLFLQSEIHYMKSSFSSFVSLQRSLNTSPVQERHNTSIDLTTISIPLSVKYTIPNEVLALYFQGGINYDHQISPKTWIASEKVYKGNLETIEKAPFTFDRNQVGYWGGIGMLKPFRYFKGSLTVRYFKMGRLNQTNGFIAKTDRLSLLLIIFRK